MAILRVNSFNTPTCKGRTVESDVPWDRGTGGKASIGGPASLAAAEAPGDRRGPDALLFPRAARVAALARRAGPRAGTLAVVAAILVVRPRLTGTARMLAVH